MVLSKERRLSLTNFVIAAASYSLLMLAILNRACGLAGIFNSRLCHPAVKCLGGLPAWST